MFDAGDEADALLLAQLFARPSRPLQVGAAARCGARRRSHRGRFVRRRRHWVRRATPTRNRERRHPRVRSTLLIGTGQRSPTVRSFCWRPRSTFDGACRRRCHALAHVLGLRRVTSATVALLSDLVWLRPMPTTHMHAVCAPQSTTPSRPRSRCGARRWSHRGRFIRRHRRWVRGRATTQPE
jgi:hypothetical protein